MEQFEAGEFLRHAFRAFLENSADMIWFKDARLRYRAASESCARAAGVESAAMLIGRRDGDIFPPALAERYEEADSRALEDGDAPERIEALTEDGNSRLCLCSRYRVLDDRGEVIGLCGMSRDLTAQVELAERNRALEKCAATDRLTGVLNRSAVLERISACLDCLGEGEGHALLFIDLDSFKGINDALGHAEGDRVLRETARRLKEVFRRGDVVGRVGGDEFLVLLRGADSPEDIINRAARVFEALPLVETPDGAMTRLSCSIGAALCEKGKSVETLYAEADQAMYRAKAKGKNKIEFWKP